MKGLYTPPPIPEFLRTIGFRDREPIEVEVLGWETEPVPRALISEAVNPDSLLGIFSGLSVGRTGNALPGVIRWVPIAQVQRVAAEESTP